MRFSPCLCALHVSFISSLLCLTYPGIYFEESGLGSYIFPSSRASRPALWPTQPPIPSVPEALSQEVERPGRKVDHSPPSSAGVNLECSYTSVPSYAFIAYIQTCPLPFEIMKPRIMQFWSPYYFPHSLVQILPTLRQTSSVHTSSLYSDGFRFITRI